MKKNTSLLALLLAALMVFTSLVACTQSGNVSSSESTDASDSQGTESESKSESNETETDGKTEDGENDDYTVPAGDDGELIAHANNLANKVTSGYVDVDRTKYVIGNSNSILSYNTSNEAPQQVTSITDKKGNAYITDTMDVFVRMKNGKTYYSSASVVSAATNIYRLGYYYYESRFENQVFLDPEEMTKSLTLNLNTNQYRGVDQHVREDGSIYYEITNANDPYVIFPKAKYKANDYKYIQVTMKASGIGANAQIFVKAGGAGEYSGEQSKDFSSSSDGQVHVYTIPIYTVENYTGTIQGVRLDINGKAGSTFEILEIKAISGGSDTDSLSLARSFLTYSDKMHQVIQIAASSKTENIEAIGMVTKFDANTVEGVVIKDRQGLHYNVADKIAWNTVEYIGFMIKGVGVFGYMLPYDGRGGTIRVTLENGYYRVEQRKAPDGWVIYPSDEGTGNASDFYMGQRIYTDTETNFDKFIYEAECEVNPLATENVIINVLKSGAAKYKGYDSLYGYYRFEVDAAEGFRGPYAEYPNRHFGVNFSIVGDDKDREIYVMTYTPMGSLECAAILNDKSMMLPIPVEVAKNFKGDGENTIFMKDDAQYGETFIPLIVKANSTDKFTILNLYQNWGNYPLKQISSIQYFNPYYHLSVGTTETNCLVPFGSGGLGLPDFRTVSAPIWSEVNPQHNSCGSHSFVRYTDSLGVFNANQINTSTIYSYGPTYADMSIDFISDDGKIKITYNHMEQPHTDENRSYFTLKLEVLGDVTINNFKEDFYFYSVFPNDPTGVYQRVGYLDSNNKSQVVAANKSGEAVEYVLGDLAPYFSFYDMDNYTAAFNNNLACDGPGYANVAMLIAGSEFIVGGEKVTPSFVLRDMTKSLRLTLDMGATTLKAGDSLTIDGILMPWGSQELEGSYDEREDKNVRDVREDSILNPLKATAVENCVTVRKSVGAFLPELQSTNGKSATFTLSGGANNNAVRVYGFDKLTVPVVEELIDGEWQVYELASINNRDRLGYGYSYDGYNVYYETDGTYSYSFVTNMDNGDRTFRITVDGEFEGWGDEKDPTEDLPMNYYITPDNMAPLGATLGNLYGCTVEMVEENGANFFRFYGKNSREGYLIPYNESPLYPTTGQYFVMKYRVPTDNKSKITYFDIFASTTEKSFTASGVQLRPANSIKRDGEWHTIIVDLTAISKYTPNEQGEYLAKFLRVDVLNWDGGNIPATDYIDIAYFGISDDISKVLAISGDEESVSFYQDSTLKKIDVASGEISVDKDPINFYFDPLEVNGMSVGGCNTMLSGDKTMVRFTSKGSAEGYLFAYENSKGSVETGQYLVIKYAVSPDVAMANNFEIFASTELAGATAGSNMSVSLIKSGKWEILVVDLSKISTFNAVDGKYYAKHVRFDIINGKYTHTEDAPSYIDVAYMGLHNNLEGIFALDKNAEYFTVIDANGKSAKYSPDGTLIEGDAEEGGSGNQGGTTDPEPVDGINVQLTPSDLAEIKPSGTSATLLENGAFVRYTATGAAEGYVNIYKNTSLSATGQYVFIRFRIPTGVTMPSDIQIYSSTVNSEAAANGGADNLQIGSIQKRDEWQLLIVDLSRIATFTPANGQYFANYIRLDMINGKYTSTDDAPSYIDIALFGINDSITEILEINSDLANAVFVDNIGKHNTIPCDGSYKEPGSGSESDANDPLNVFLTPDELIDARVRNLNKSVSENGDYIRYTAIGAAEGSVFVYENPAATRVTGQYFVFKYRVPAEVTAMAKNIEIFASTTNATENGADTLLLGDFISDGEWHVMVIDLSKIASYTANGDSFSAKYIRLDIINGKYQSDSYVDMAYVGIHDSLEEISELNSDMDSLWLVDAEGKGATVTLGEQ